MAQRYEGDGRGREGGRSKGTPNKINQAAREALAKLVLSPKALRQMAKDMEALTPYQRVQMQEKLISYLLPKMASVEADLSAQVEDVTPRRLSMAEAAALLKHLEDEY